MSLNDFYKDINSFILNLIENFDNIKSYLEIVNKLLVKKIIKFNNLKYGLVEFINDYEDYKWDYTNLNVMLKTLLNELKILKMLTDDNIKFIFSKIDQSVKDILI